MFSGRITEVGTVTDAGDRLIIEAPKTAGSVSVGGSVNGACLSAVEAGGPCFGVEVPPETVNRSTLGGLRPGDRINLELPLRVGDPLDGHLVQGHVDAVGKVMRAEEETGGTRRLWIRPPRRFLDDIVAKGFTALDGVSVTVAEVVRDRFSVALIPITLRETTLADLGPADRVNLEADLFVRSARELHAAARLVAARSLAALPWSGELRGPAGVQKAAAQLAAGGGVVIYDPDREGEADVVFAGVGLRPASLVPAHPGVRAYNDPMRPRPAGPAGDPADAWGRGQARHGGPRLGRSRRGHRHGCIGPRTGRDRAPPCLSRCPPG
jgi:3,4-dihydroxy 2-butanone 4-phosphate synthase